MGYHGRKFGNEDNNEMEKLFKQKHRSGRVSGRRVCPGQSQIIALDFGSLVFGRVEPFKNLLRVVVDVPARGFSQASKFEKSETMKLQIH